MGKRGGPRLSITAHRTAVGALRTFGHCERNSQREFAFLDLLFFPHFCAVSEDFPQLKRERREGIRGSARTPLLATEFK